MRAISLSTVAVPALLFLNACNQAPAPAANDMAAPVAQGGNQAPEAAPPSANVWNGGQAKALDIQVAHPNGTVLQLTSLKSDATSTVIALRVMNGRDRDVELNRWNSRQGYILLDTGERLYLSPPTSNPRLSIPAGQTFEGELVFLGRLPAVRSAMLVLNENAQRDSEYTTTPGFRIDLPLTAQAAATPQAVPGNAQ